ncbi:MAG: response regulator transcription factor [Acidobacteria bacterium]|nr:response regulator transcription factor [Acidobacteriota bacterium]MCB9399077.1 response regulator transcription factor [Acidobacteriota bacterium]
MNYLILDDEPLAHQIIEQYAANLPELRKIANCFDAFQARNVLNDQTIDLMFLDVEMPKLQGFAFLRSLAKKPQVIVISAHPEYALDGFDLAVCDYLLKPFSLERFLKAVNKAQDARDGQKKDQETIFIKDGKKYHQVPLNQLLWVEACGNYCLIQLENKKILTLEKISEIEKLLPASGFVRVHKSFIVAIAQIHEIEGNEIALAQKRIPIGRTYKKKVQDLLPNS